MNRYLDEKNGILDFLRRDVEPAAGDKGWGAIVVKGVKSIDKSRRAVEAVLSAADHDRYGEIILPSAYGPWMKRFNENPVLLSGHDHDKQVGHWENMKITATTLEGWAVFDDKPSNQEAQKLWGLIEGGHRKGFSVGAIMHEWRMLTADEVAALLPKFVQAPQFEGRVRVFTSSEPIEGSSVAVPASPSSLSKSALARGAGAVDDLDLDTLTGGGGEDGKLSNRQLAIASRALAPVIRQVVRRELSADPYGGPLFNLVRDIVDVVLDLQAERSGHTCGGGSHFGDGFDETGKAIDSDDDNHEAQLGDDDLSDALEKALAGGTSRRRR